MKKIWNTLKLKWAEYLLEILVIVASILGAFALESWNEDQLDREREYVILNQLKEDYQNNLKQLDEKITMRNIMVAAATDLLKAVDNDTQSWPYDSLILKIATLHLDPTFDPVANNLIEPGTLAILRDHKLKGIVARWSSDVIQLQENEREWQRVRTEHLIPFFFDNKLYRNSVSVYWDGNMPNLFLLDKGYQGNWDIGKTKNPIPIRDVLNHSQFEEILSAVLMFSRASNFQSYALRDRIVEIIDLIDVNLARMN